MDCALVPEASVLTCADMSYSSMTGGAHVQRAPRTEGNCSQKRKPGARIQQGFVWVPREVHELF